MVDSIGPVGQAQGVQSIKNIQDRAQEKSGVSESSAPVDAVQISDEALSLAQVERAAQDAGTALQNDSSATLSNDQERLNALV